MLSLIIGLMSFVTAVDIRSLRVPDSLTFALAASGLFLHGITHIGSLLFLSSIGLTAYYLPRTPKIGKGDIKLMAAAGLFIPLSFLGIFCILAGLSGVLCSFSRLRCLKTRCFPFAPSISFALLVVILLAG